MVHFIWPLMTVKLFSLPLTKVGIHFGHVKMYATPYHISWINIYIRFGTTLYRQIVGISMGTNCAPLVADLFLYCYKRDFMGSLKLMLSRLSIRLLGTSMTSLNIDKPYFEGMVNEIYPPELQLNKANTTGTEAPFLDLHLSIANGFVSSKIHDKRDDWF